LEVSGQVRTGQRAWNSPPSGGSGRPPAGAVAARYIAEEKRAVLRSKRWVAIAWIAVILLAVCLVGQAAADCPLSAHEPSGREALASIRLVMAALLATTVAGLIVVGLFSRARPR